jgi:ABC-type antimicrobial peptide transport system permease subunit
MQYYVPPSQVPPPPGGIAPGPRVSGLLVRGASDPAALAGPIRKLVLQEKTDLPFLRVRAYSSLLERQLGPWMLGWQLLAIFSVLALAVAAMGLFATFAHAVTVRRREMAIRVAIGATRAGVVRLILREAAALAAAGIVVGALAAVAGGRSLQMLLFGIVPADPAVLGAAAAAMSVVALAATIIPARRASQSDPGSLLKQD